MNPVNASFNDLVKGRREWRAFHERQDRANADRVFHRAGVSLITESDVMSLPEFFHAKLNDFGRDWERALAAQGLREGFYFYQAQLSIAVEEVNRLHSWIEAALDSSGASLFFESDGPKALKDGVWDSNFYFTLKADVSPESLDFAHAPGVRKVGKIVRIK